MPLGDSITYGVYSGYNPPADEATGYRQPLYIALTAAGYRVDFVGSLETGWDATPPFDIDHEGHPRWRDSEVADYVYEWLVTNPADVILLHIGSNYVDPSPVDVEEILNEIDRYESDNEVRVTVVLARIINRVPYSATVTQFNNNVEAMARARIAAGDKIVLVDMEAGAGIIYQLYPEGDMADTLHPYATGYEKMAAVWRNALVNQVLPRCPAGSGTFVNKAYLPAIVSN